MQKMMYCECLSTNKSMLKSGAKSCEMAHDWLKERARGLILQWLSGYMRNGPNGYCPWSSPCVVWALFADPGPGPGPGLTRVNSQVDPDPTCRYFTCGNPDPDLCR